MALALIASAQAEAQQAAPSTSQPEPQPPEITVTGRRIPGSAIGTVDPVAVLDEQALEALGATNLGDLLKKVKPLTGSSSGGEPVTLLNGRRISGFAEIQSLPYEAIERMEILPEAEAARFGYPPTVRVMNFITKKKFRAVTVQQVSSVVTDGGGATSFADLGSARIDGSRRITLRASARHQVPIYQSQRDIVADPGVLFATVGNVTGSAGGSLDPRLDRLAGRAVAAAGVPADPAARRMLAAYADSPVAASDTGRFRMLQPLTDTIEAEGGLASPLGDALSGSLQVSMQAARSKGLNGLAPPPCACREASGLSPSPMTPCSTAISPVACCTSGPAA